jgi:hypothetical protein
VPDVVESPSPVGEADLADALLELALDATRLRVRAGAPSLQEATAALQDLASQAVAGDDERLGARQAEVAALLETLPPTIQSAPDGPYLITNIAGLTDCLGVPLAATRRQHCAAAAPRSSSRGAMARTRRSASTPSSPRTASPTGWTDIRASASPSVTTAVRARTRACAPTASLRRFDLTGSRSSRRRADASMRSSGRRVRVPPAR